MAKEYSIEEQEDVHRQGGQGAQAPMLIEGDLLLGTYLNASLALLPSTIVSERGCEFKMGGGRRLHFKFGSKLTNGKQGL